MSIKVDFLLTSTFASCILNYLHCKSRYIAKNYCFICKDLAASLENLHRSGISKPSKTAVFGISAGGLAAAVICNEMPQLFQAAVLQVLFFLIVSVMLYIM